MECSWNSEDEVGLVIECLLGRWAPWEHLLLSCRRFPEFLTHTGVGSCLGSVRQEKLQSGTLKVPLTW